MEVRIKPSSRIGGWVVNNKLTITKKWTTVTKSEAKKLLTLEHRGSLLFESADAEADEAEVEEAAEETE